MQLSCHEFRASGCGNLFRRRGLGLVRNLTLELLSPQSAEVLHIGKEAFRALSGKGCYLHRLSPDALNVHRGRRHAKSSWHLDAEAARSNAVKEEMYMPTCYIKVITAYAEKKSNAVRGSS